MHEEPRDLTRAESPAEAFKQLAVDLTAIAREQLDAARQEMTEKIKAAGVGAGMLSASAVAGVLTVVCLTALVAVALAIVLPAWLAVLVVTLFWALACGVLAVLGRNRVKNAVPFVPEETLGELKEDLAWATRHRRASGK